MFITKILILKRRKNPISKLSSTKRQMFMLCISIDCFKFKMQFKIIWKYFLVSAAIVSHIFSIDDASPSDSSPHPLEMCVIKIRCKRKHESSTENFVKSYFNLVWSKIWIVSVCCSLLPNSGFVLDKKFQQNAWKFAIFDIYKYPKLLFRFSFRATLYFPLMNALVYVDIHLCIH